MPNLPLAYVSVYQRMSDNFIRNSYVSLIRNNVTGPLHWHALRITQISCHLSLSILYSGTWYAYFSRTRDIIIITVICERMACAVLIMRILLRTERKEKEMFHLTTHSAHFIYGYMASDIWLRTILIVRKETLCRHIGYSYRLTARVLLYAPSQRQDSTYHGLCYTSRGALAGTRNSSMGSPHKGSIRRPIAPWANVLTTELHLAPLLLRTLQDIVIFMWPVAWVGNLLVDVSRLLS